MRDFTVYKKLPENPVRKLVEQYPIGKFPKQTRRLKRYSCFPLRNPSSISSLQTHFFDNSFRLPYIEPFHSTKSWKFKRDSTPIESPVSLTEKSFLSYVHVFTALKIHHQISSFSFSFTQRLLFYNHEVTGRLSHVCNQPIKAYVFFATSKENFVTDQKFELDLSCSQIMPLLALCK